MRKLRKKDMTEDEALDFFNQHFATCTMCGVHHCIGDEYTYYYYEEE